MTLSPKKTTSIKCFSFLTLNRFHCFVIVIMRMQEFTLCDHDSLKKCTICVVAIKIEQLFHRGNISKNINVTYDDAVLTQQDVFTWSVFCVDLIFLFVIKPVNTAATTHFFCSFLLLSCVYMIVKRRNITKKCLEWNRRKKRTKVCLLVQNFECRNITRELYFRL
jgi:hypothetical protein